MGSDGVRVTVLVAHCLRFAADVGLQWSGGEGGGDFMCSAA